MIVDERPNVGYGEFYITHVCNLNCSECIRMNNFHFTGHQRWDDYADDYTELSKKVSFDIISISGGESFLNPDFKKWVAGIRKLWPESTIWIGTNGSRLKYIDQLYDLLIDNKAHISISAHGRNMFNEITSNINNLLQHPISVSYRADVSKWVDVFNKNKNSDWPECNSIEEYEKLPIAIKDQCALANIDPHSILATTGSIVYTDANGVKIFYNHSYEFRSSPVKYSDDTNQFTVYDCDPNKSHDVCFSKTCHVLHKGKLYKCAHVAVLPDFIEQFNVNISKEDKKLLLDYKPLGPDSTLEEAKEFSKRIKKTIPQCKLCPSDLKTTQIEATTQKKKVIKIKKLS